MHLIFALVNFPGHHGQTSPPSALDKVSNQELSLSGFPSRSKTESSKVSWAAALPLNAASCASLIHAMKTSLLMMKCRAHRSLMVQQRAICNLCYLQQTDTRRITHISAEQKRRFNIKLGFDTLHNLVTTLSSQPSIKVQSSQCSWFFLSCWITYLTRDTLPVCDC